MRGISGAGDHRQEFLASGRIVAEAAQETANNTTQKFVAMWGEDHRLHVVGWFEQAQQDMG